MNTFGGMSLYEWLEKTEEIDNGKEFMKSLLDEEHHYGDCTKHAHTCTLCLLENLLGNFYIYSKGLQYQHRLKSVAESIDNSDDIVTYMVNGHKLEFHLDGIYLDDKLIDVMPFEILEQRLNQKLEV